jgi:hypothetical protein
LQDLNLLLAGGLMLHGDLNLLHGNASLLLFASEQFLLLDCLSRKLIDRFRSLL